jgi:hypothetical protein
MMLLRAQLRVQEHSPVCQRTATRSVERSACPQATQGHIPDPPPCALLQARHARNGVSDARAPCRCARGRRHPRGVVTRARCFCRRLEAPAAPSMRRKRRT